MKHIRVENYRTSENSYIIYNEHTLDGAVIDPGNPVSDILDAANKNSIKIRYILITHCHYDHIEYLEELREKTGAPLVSGDKASINITDPDINVSYAGLGYELSAKKSDIILNDNEILKIGDSEVKCIYTPGHTNCGVCYLTDDGIFVGDTLFLRNCGRWDLPTGDEQALMKSIRERLYTLPDDTKVYPGHGEGTSIGYEKKFNFIVKA